MQKDNQYIEQTLTQVINEFCESPIDLLGIGDHDAERRYVKNQYYFYLRTVLDVLRYCPLGKADVKILEIGAFLGIVSICLKRLGYKVTSSEIPIFHKNERLQALYSKNSIELVGLDLRDYKMPFADAQFDLVIMCETLEHLNFNPVPMLYEVNRIEKVGGALYLSLPNIARWDSRKRLLFGQSIHNPISDFYSQYEQGSNMVVGLHWREYSIAEIKELVTRVNYQVIEQYFFEAVDVLPKPKLTPKRFIKKLIYFKRSCKKWLIQTIPSLKENQTTISRKISNTNVDLFFHE